MSKAIDTAAIEWRELVPASVAIEAEQWQNRVHQAIATSVMVTGQALRAMKPQMPHGAFEAWWRQELGLKDRKLVSDLMAASELLEGQASDTPLAMLPPRSLAILHRAGNGQVLEEAVSRLEAGQRVTEADARRIAADRGVKPVGMTAKMRCYGVLDDQRAAVMAGFITGRNAAMARFDALEAAARLDPTLAKLTNEQRVKSSHPLGKLMADAVDEVFAANQQLTEYKDWCWDHPMAVAPLDSPLWQQVGPELVEAYKGLRGVIRSFADGLAGHRDPEGAMRAWIYELDHPRGRAASPAEAVLSKALEPWEVYVRWLLDTARDEALAKQGE
jgi:hypothetical protein